MQEYKGDDDDERAHAYLRLNDEDDDERDELKVILGHDENRKSRCA